MPAPAPAKKKKVVSKKTVDDYVRGLKGWQKDVVSELRKVILSAAPKATESIKWAQPVYEANGPFCYVRAFTNTVNFGFWRGADLADGEPRLQSGGQRMAHIKIAGPEDVDVKAFAVLVRKAVALNAKQGDPTKR
jgi:hypothetical protein